MSDTNWEYLPHGPTEARRIQRDRARQGLPWYVYMLVGESGEVFYIGKGRHERFAVHRWRWGDYLTLFESFFLTERDAYAAEAEAICYGRAAGWPLRNIAPGGPLSLPRDRTPEQKARATARSNTPENRERKRQKAKRQWAERRTQMVEAIRERCTTEAFRAKMSAISDPETRGRASRIRWDKARSL